MTRRFATTAAALALAAALAIGTSAAQADEGDTASSATAGTQGNATDTTDATDARSPEVAEAERCAAEAYDAYTRRDYAGAVGLYLRALKVSPSAGVLYNLARIYDTKLRDRELAASFYRRYIVDPGADPEHLRIANERLTVLRELEASSLTSRSAVPAPKPPPPTPVPARGISGLQIAALVSGAVGLASLGVGIAFGVSAKSDADVAKGFCDGDDCRTQRGVDAAHDASDAATISTVCFAAGGALALAGTAMAVFGRRDRARDDTAGVRVTPYASARALGVGLGGRW